MTIPAHHGSRVLRSDETPVLVRSVNSSIVALLGTAPSADAGTFPIDTPVLIQGAEGARLGALLGTDGTLKAALDAVLDQVGTQIWIIRVEEGLSAAETLTNLVGDPTAFTGVHALARIGSDHGRHLRPRIVAAPGHTATLATAGVATVAVTAPGAGYAAAPIVTVTPESGNTPTVPAKLTAVLGTGAEAGTVTQILIEQPGEGYTETGDGPTVTIADPISGVTATATITIGAVGSPVVHELAGLLPELRAVAFVDGPGTTDAAAIAAAARYGSDRIYLIDPGGQVWDSVSSSYVATPLSAHFAGVQARVDREFGTARSVSNQPIRGVDRPSRPISYGLQTDSLNFGRVNTIVNHGAGLVTWGNRSTTGSSIWAFLNVRRMADAVDEALERAYLEFVDRNPTPYNLEFMIQAGLSFLRDLEADGQILPGSRVWLDPDLNSASSAATGRWTISVAFEPYAPIEDLRLAVHRDVSLYQGLIEEISASIADGALAVSDL